MKQSIFGFIGCGNMGGALATAVAKSLDGDVLLLCDAAQEKAEAKAKECGARCATLETVARESDYIFLGVKPQGYDALFETLRPILKSRKSPAVLISMAAGITLAHVSALADCRSPIIRIMPNTPVSVGEGMILYSANRETADAQIETFLQALAKAGKLDAIAEEKIDAASALSGCGPAFVYLFAEALADGAVECGLSRDQALFYASQTLLGAAKLLQESGKHPGELKDAVCSPGGTTIAGVHVLEDGAFRATAMGAVTAAYERTLELKK